MRSRCRAVHDFNPRLERGLRCTEPAGHLGPCKPKAWEHMARSTYRRLVAHPYLREAK